MISKFQIYPEFIKVSDSVEYKSDIRKRTWEISTSVDDRENAQQSLENFFDAANLGGPVSWNMISDLMTSEKIEKRYDALKLNLTVDADSTYLFIHRLLLVFSELDKYYPDKEFFLYVIIDDNDAE